MSHHGYWRDSYRERSRSRSPISHRAYSEDHRRVQLLEMEVTRARNELHAAKNRMHVLEDENQTTRQLHARLITAYKDKNEQLTMTENKLNDHQMKFANVDSTNTVLRRQVNTQFAEIRELKEELSQLKSTKEKSDTLSERLAKVVAERDVAVNQGYADLQKLKNVEELLSMRNKNLEEAEVAKTNAEAKYIACQSENSRLGEQLKGKDYEISTIRHQAWRTGEQHRQEIKDLRRVLQEEVMKFELEKRCEEIMRTLCEAKTIQFMQLEELQKKKNTSR